MRSEHDRGQHEAEHHVDHDAGGERQERLGPGLRQVFDARGQADAEEAEDESPGPQILDRRDQRRVHDLVEIGKAVSARSQGDDDRRDQEPNHELRKPPPDFGRIGPAAGDGFPPGGGDDREHEGPHTDPDVAAYHFHQREGPDRLIGGAGDAFVARQVAIRLPGRIGEFRGADPCAGDAGVELQRPRRERQGEDHDDCPQHHDRDGDGRMLAFGADRAGDGDCR